jgi:cytochrome b involved in lipid metabolism
MTIYRLSEVASHNTKSDSWLVIHNKVYDITKFLTEHPGGEEVLLDVAGTESTDAFEDVGHSNDARDMLADYHIGDCSLYQGMYISVPQISKRKWF